MKPAFFALLIEDALEDDTLVLTPEDKLFHGSGEPFPAEELKVGGYDQILWTADASAIAQSYIPTSGASVMVSSRGLWDFPQHPHPHDHWIFNFQRKRLGLDYKPERAKWDGNRLSSFHVPEQGVIREPVDPEHPDWYPQVDREAMNGRVNAVLKSMGYEPRHEMYGGDHHWNLLLSGNEIMPADYRKPGRLFVLTPKPGAEVRIFDYAKGRESDLTDLDYHKHDLFSAVERKGFDGIRITDFAQIDYGPSQGKDNLGHLSIGIFQDSIKKFDVKVIEDVRHPTGWDDMHSRGWQSDEWKAHLGENLSEKLHGQQYRIDYTALDHDEEEYDGVGYAVVSRALNPREISSGKPWRITFFDEDMVPTTHIPMEEPEEMWDWWSDGEDGFLEALQDYVNPNIIAYDLVPDNKIESFAKLVESICLSEGYMQAALKYGDKVYTGQAHFQCWLELMKDETGAVDVYGVADFSREMDKKGAVDGFLTDEGVFLNREEAGEYYKMLRGKTVIDDDEPEREWLDSMDLDRDANIYGIGLGE